MPTPRERPRRPDTGGPAPRPVRSLPWLITAFALACAGVTLSLPLRMKPALWEVVTPEYVAMLRMVDSTAQRRAHLVALVALAGATLAARCLTRGGRTGSLRCPLTDGVVGRVLRYGGAVLLLAMFWSTDQGPTGVAVAVICLVVAAVFVATGHRTLRAQETPRRRALGWVAVGACLAPWLAIGLVLPVLMPEQLLFDADWHYCATIAQGSRLAAGMPLLDMVQPNYGLLPVLAQAAAERRWGPLDFGGAVRLVQWSQVAFALMILAGLVWWRPRRPLIALVSLAFFAPWLGTLGDSDYHPNQTGWRSLGLAAGVLALVALRRVPFAAQSAALAATGGVLILFNPETGIAVCVGFALFLAARCGPGWRLAVAPAVFGVAVLGVVIAATVLMFRMLDPGLAAGLAPGRLKQFAAFLGGFGGLPLQADVLALVIFVHCMAIAARRGLELTRRRVPADGAVELGIAGIILVWYAYYWNRPDPWNLWTFTALYAFLLARWLDPRWIGRFGRGSPRVLCDLRFGLVFFVVVPQLVQINIAFARKSAAIIRETPRDAGRVSGVRLDPALAAIVADKSRYLDEAPVEAPVVYVSHFSFMMLTLTGRPNPLPVQDVFGETLSNRDFDELVTRLRDVSPGLIVFDDPDAADAEACARYSVGVFRRAFDERLQDALASDYARLETRAGWDVWGPRSAPGADPPDAERSAHPGGRSMLSLPP